MWRESKLSGCGDMITFRPNAFGKIIRFMARLMGHFHRTVAGARATGWLSPWQARFSPVHRGGKLALVSSVQCLVPRGGLVINHHQVYTRHGYTATVLHYYKKCLLWQLKRSFCVSFRNQYHLRGTKNQHIGWYGPTLKKSSMMSIV
jgi:hypothetical protein